MKCGFWNCGLCRQSTSTAEILWILCNIRGKCFFSPKLRSDGDHQLIFSAGGSFYQVERFSREYLFDHELYFYANAFPMNMGHDSHIFSNSLRPFSTLHVLINFYYRFLASGFNAVYIIISFMLHLGKTRFCMGCHCFKKIIENTLARIKLNAS